MKKLYTLFLILFTTSAFAQNPTVSGDSMLCPNSSGILTTQPYDTYQWYVRYFGSSTIAPINGATSQSLVIDYASYAASYLSVEVTLGANDYISPEFFVDGYAFAGITVMSSGNFTIGPNGESVLCPGDTMYFEVLQPYDTTITWYNNGDTMPGINTPMLTVTGPGVYYVTAAPTQCPMYVEGPGVDLTVLDCTVGINDPIASSKITAYPNPSNGKIHLSNVSSYSPFVIEDGIGKIVMTGTFSSSETDIDISGLVSGIYFLKAGTGSIMIVKQ